jgi:hypothetical protein
MHQHDRTCCSKEAQLRSAVSAADAKISKLAPADALQAAATAAASSCEADIVAEVSCEHLRERSAFLRGGGGQASVLLLRREMQSP